MLALPRELVKDMGKSNGTTRTSTAGAPKGLSEPVDASKVERKIVEYVRDNEWSLTPAEKAYLESRMTEQRDLYRFIGTGDELDLKVGDTLNYDKIKSFSGGTAGAQATLKIAGEIYDLEAGVLLHAPSAKGYGIKGIVSKNRAEFGYGGSVYVDQNEVLSTGKFRVTGISHKTFEDSWGEKVKMKVLHIELIR